MATASDRGLEVRFLGLVPYDEALEHQRTSRESVAAGGADQLLLLEHPPTVTLGRRTLPEHLSVPIAALRARGVSVHEVQRGGSVTYHGPGQLVGYAIVNLGRCGLGMHGYLRVLERALIEALAEFGVAASSREGLTGVWTSSGKIAAIGIGVRRGVTFHGFALNVSVDLAAFSLIIPCGLADEPVTSMAALGCSAPLDKVGAAVASRLAAELARASCPAAP